MATKYKQHFESFCSNVVVQIRQPSHRIPNILWSWWSEYSRNFRWDFAQSEFKSRVNEIVHQPRPIKLALVHLAKVHTSRNYPHLQGLSPSCGVTDILFLVSLGFKDRGGFFRLCAPSSTRGGLIRFLETIHLTKSSVEITTDFISR